MRKAVRKKTLFLEFALGDLRKKKEAFAFLFLFAIYWGFCSASHFWGGFCPPGRPLLPVQWILAVFAAGALAWGQGKMAVPVRRTLILLSFAVLGLSISNPRLLYHENLSFRSAQKGLASNLLTSLSNSFIDWTKFVPSLSADSGPNWMALIAWILVIAGITVVFLIRKKPTATKANFRPSSHLIIVFFLSLAFLGYFFFDIHLEKSFSFENKDFLVFPQDDNNLSQELDGFWTWGKSKCNLLLFSTRPAKEIAFTLSSPVGGRTTIKVGWERKIVQRKKDYEGENSVSLPAPPGFPWRGGYLYWIHIQETAGFRPFRIERKNTDNRYLGVFVRINVQD